MSREPRQPRVGGLIRLTGTSLCPVSITFTECIGPDIHGIRPGTVLAVLFRSALFRKCPGYGESECTVVMLPDGRVGVMNRCCTDYSAV